MPFGLKNAGATYMRAMATIFHDMIHKEIEMYVDDVIIKSRESSDHVTHLRKFFERLRRYNLKLNPAKCAFGVPAGKLLGFIVSRRVLVPPREGSPLLLYLSVSDSAFGCVLGQHDETGKKENSIYYISKKFTPYESRYTLLERTCCADVACLEIETLLVFIHHVSHFQNGSIEVHFPKSDADWKKAIKAQALADHLAENPIDEEYEPLKTYFHDEEVSFMGEDISEVYPGWRLFLDGAANHQGKGVGAVLVSESGQHYPIAAKLRFNYTNNMAEYEACILGIKMAVDMNVYELLFRKIEFRHTPKIQNELVDALDTIASMIKHPDTDYIDPLDIELKEHPVHCSHVESEPDGLPWYFDIKRYLESGTYPEEATSNQKKSIRRMALNFFLNGEVLYRRTLDLGLLRCVDAVEAVRLIETIHAGVCAWGMDVINPIEPSASNGHRFILVAIDYFTKWVEAASYKSVTKKVVADFVLNNLICRFGIPEFIITDNGENLNSHMMKEICEQFKIIHRRSTAYSLQMNGAVEAANKNIKKILRKMIDK
nr:uncharacterized protein LOC109120902 [Solanum lycopersicum]